MATTTSLTPSVPVGDEPQDVKITRTEPTGVLKCRMGEPVYGEFRMDDIQMDIRDLGCASYVPSTTPAGERSTPAQPNGRGSATAQWNDGRSSILGLSITLDRALAGSVTIDVLRGRLAGYRGSTTFDLAYDGDCVAGITGVGVTLQALMLRTHGVS